jgi:glycosyltransferase involved in cell wall biosynthesis
MFEVNRAKKFKIVFCSQKPEDLSTGGVRQIADVIRYFDKSGICVQFLDRKPRFNGIISDVLKNFWYISKFLKIKEENIIVVEPNSERYSFFLFNIFISIFLRKKFHLVGIVQAFYHSYRTSFIKNWMDRLLSYLFLQGLNLIITSGKSAQDELVKMGVPASRINNVYLATREEFAKNVESNSHNNTSKKILFAGRLHPVKGVEYLIEAINILKDRDIKLFVVGDFEENIEYSRKIFEMVRRFGIGDKIEFIGRIFDDWRLAEFYRSSDILVLPSVWDTSPITLVEAMCFGLPIVASKVGGIPEYVEDGVNGILVHPKDSQELAKAISLLIDNCDLREELRKGSFRKSFEYRNRTWEDVGKEYYQILSGLWKRQGEDG